MPTLTRRRDPDAAQETWLIYYGDLHVGTIGIRAGNPVNTDLWFWRCGFSPGSKPGECTSGTTENFARACGLPHSVARVPIETDRGWFPGVA
jgi:hypothetical protein